MFPFHWHVVCRNPGPPARAARAAVSGRGGGRWCGLETSRVPGGERNCLSRCCNNNVVVLFFFSPPWFGVRTELKRFQMLFRRHVLCVGLGNASETTPRRMCAARELLGCATLSDWRESIHSFVRCETAPIGCACIAPRERRVPWLCGCFALGVLGKPRSVPVCCECLECDPRHRMPSQTFRQATFILFMLWCSGVFCVCLCLRLVFCLLPSACRLLTSSTPCTFVPSGRSQPQPPLQMCCTQSST